MIKFYLETLFFLYEHILGYLNPVNYNFWEAYNLIENWFRIYDNFYKIWFGLLRESLVYHCFLIGFENYDDVISSYIQNNYNSNIYPKILELYAEQLDISFYYLQIYHNLSNFDVSINNTVQNYRWSFFEKINLDLLYQDTIYLKAYYDHLLGLPLNFVKFAKHPEFCKTFGINFDIEFNQLRSEKLFFETSESSLQRIILSLDKNFTVKSNTLSYFANWKNLNNQISWKINNNDHDNDVILVRDNLNYWDKTWRYLRKSPQPSHKDLTYDYTYNDKLRTIWDYIRVSSDYSKNYELVHTWNVRERDFFFDNYPSWWDQKQIDNYLFRYYNYNFIVNELLSSFNFKGPFDFDENGEYYDLYNETLQYYDYDTKSVLWGASAHDFWLSFLTDSYVSYIWKNIIFGRINSFDHTPHLQSDNLYTFITSLANKSEINIYSESYFDVLKDKARGKYDLYNLVLQANDGGLNGFYPLKNDNLIFYINMYKNLDNFYTYYFEFRKWIYNFTHLYEIFTAYLSDLQMRYVWKYRVDWSLGEKTKAAWRWWFWLEKKYFFYEDLVIFYFTKKYFYWVFSFLKLITFLVFFYIFSAGIMSILPQNLGYNRRGVKLKFKKNKTSNFLKNLSKKFQYKTPSIENIDNIFFEFIIKINNLESWIFNIDTNFIKNNKISRFFKIDKKSRNEYISNLKKNHEYLYQDFISSDSIKTYKDNTRIRSTEKYLFLIMQRSRLKLKRSFFRWVFNKWQDVYLNIGRSGFSSKLNNYNFPNNILKWPQFISKLLLSYLLWPTIFLWLTFTWALFLYIMRSIWFSERPLFKYFFKRQSFNNYNLHRTIDDIKRVLTNLDLEINEVNKNLNTFRYRELSISEKANLNKQRSEEHLSLLKISTTPGGRVYFLLNLFFRIIFVWWHHIKIINTTSNGRDLNLFNNTFSQNIKKSFLHIYWEYVLWRRDSRAFNPKPQRFILFWLEFVFGICLPFTFLVSPLIILYYCFFYCFAVKEKSTRNIDIILHNFGKKYNKHVWFRFFKKIIFYVLSFWRFVFVDSKTDQSLITRFYVKIFYPWFCKTLIFCNKLKCSYQFGIKQNKGFYFVYKYIKLKVFVFVYDKIAFIYNTYIIYLLNKICNSFYLKNFLLFIQSTKKENFLNYELYFLIENLYHFWVRRLKQFLSKIVILIYILMMYFLYNLDFLQSHLLLNYFAIKYSNYPWKAYSARLYFEESLMLPNLFLYKKAFLIYVKKKNLTEGLKLFFIFFVTYYTRYYKRRRTGLAKIRLFSIVHKYDGSGFLKSIEQKKIKIKWFNNLRIKIHLFFYNAGISYFVSSPVLSKRYRSLLKKKHKIRRKYKETWYTNFDIIELFVIRTYFFYLTKFLEKYQGYIHIFENTYRSLDNNELTWLWPLWKRFRFVYYELKSNGLTNRKWKKINKKKDKLGYQEIKLQKKANRRFIIKALFNFVNLFLFKGKFQMIKIKIYRLWGRKIEPNAYLDYNHKKLPSYLWFLAFLYRRFYSNIFKYYYSGENLNCRYINEQKAFKRIAWPGVVNFEIIPSKAIAWVYNTGRFAIKILYSPVTNWPLRMVFSIIGYLAKQGRSLTMKHWYRIKVRDLGLTKRKESKFINTWNNIISTINHSFINRNILELNFNLFKINENEGFGAVFKPVQDPKYIYAYDFVKKRFQKSLNKKVKEDVYIKFLMLVIKRTSKTNQFPFFKKMYQKHKLTLFDLLEYRFADFVKTNYPPTHEFYIEYHKPAEILKQKVELKKQILLAELNDRYEHLEMLKNNIKDLRDLEYLESELLDEKNWKYEVEEKLEEYKEELEAQKATELEIKDNITFNWLSDKYYDIEYADNMNDLHYVMSEAFKTANRFYYWKSYISILKVYIEWSKELLKESETNNVIDEKIVLSRVWDNILNKSFGSIYTDGGSTVDAYYNYAWDCLYNYIYWAKDEDFDFAAQMQSRVQEVFLHNYYVITLGKKYFSIYLPKKKNKKDRPLDWDTITHSPLHYYRYFIQYNKWGWIYPLVSWVFFFLTVSVLLFLPGEFVVNYHLLLIPFNIWVISHIMYYYYYKPFNEVMKTKGVLFYKLSWKNHNPYSGDTESTSEYFDTYTRTFTQNMFFLWKDEFWGNILWIFTFCWYWCEWYETDAWRHRWFAWDYSSDPFVNIGLQDQIYDDGIARLCGGKNYFTLIYANTFRIKAKVDTIPMASKYDIVEKDHDLIVGNDISMRLNDFVEKCTFYTKFLLCTDKMRHRYPDYDITNSGLTPKESLESCKYQLNKFLLYRLNKNNENKNNIVLKYKNENSSFLNININDIKEWWNSLPLNIYKWLDIRLSKIEKVIAMLESEDFWNKDFEDWIDFVDSSYFFFSQYCYSYYIYTIENILIIVEIVKNFFS